MDMGLIGGFAFAFGVHKGCEKACEIDPQGFLFLSVFALIVALGARYVIKHSDDDKSDPNRPRTPSENPSDSPP